MCPSGGGGPEPAEGAAAGKLVREPSRGDRQPAPVAHYDCDSIAIPVAADAAG
jgi:hypothetical protein